MTRNFGMNVRAEPGGGEHPLARSSANNTRADPYPLPPGSIRADPLDEADKERAALSFFGAFIFAVFVTPLILAGIMML